ncbi:MAG: phosphoribosylamine--glycine ligase [Nitrospirae bacterium]|nr:phosphoribosylamine--glycine ligase [Nitrospirota bacterium]
MKVLVLGDGGREHAIIWKLSRSKNIEKIYCCPGNAGITSYAECIELNNGNLDALVDFVKYEWIDLVFIGSEKFITQDAVSLFRREGCRVIGPDLKAFRLQSSRVFTHDLFKFYGIPMPEYKTFSAFLHAFDYIMLKGAPVLIKTDGRIQNAGIFQAQTVDEAIYALKQIMKEKILNDAGNHIIISEIPRGLKLSFVFLTDGNNLRHLATVRKKIANNIFSKTLMCFSQEQIIIEEIKDILNRKVISPFLDAINSEGIKFKGIFSMDLFLNDGQIFFNDINCTFDYLEAQTILPLMKTDLMDIFTAIMDERLDNIEIKMEDKMSLTTMIFSENDKNIISGIDALDEDIHVFHENTCFSNNDIVTNGNQVLSINVVSNSKDELIQKTVSVLNKIKFKGIKYEFDKDFISKGGLIEGTGFDCNGK